MIQSLWILFLVAAACSAGIYNGVLPGQLAGVQTLPITTGITLVLLIFLFGRMLLKMGGDDLAVGDEPAPRPRALATTGSASAPRPVVAVRQAEVARNKAVLTTAAVEAARKLEPQTVRIDGHDGHFIEVETLPGADGVVVTVTAHNYSGNKFNAQVRGKLVRIKNVDWESPVNLGKGESDRRRQMIGRTTEASLASVMAGIALVK